MACLIFHEECISVLPQLGGSDANWQEYVCYLHGSTCVHSILRLYMRRWLMLLVLFTAPSHCFNTVSI